jgi:hypothetical protein
MLDTKMIITCLPPHADDVVLDKRGVNALRPNLYSKLKFKPSDRG